MKKIITLTTAAVIALGLSGCGDAYYNVGPGHHYETVSPVVYEEVAPAPVRVKKVVTQDRYRYLRRNAHGYRYYY